MWSYLDVENTSRQPSSTPTGAASAGTVGFRQGWHCRAAAVRTSDAASDWNTDQTLRSCHSTAKQHEMFLVTCDLTEKSASI